MDDAPSSSSDSVSDTASTDTTSNSSTTTATETVRPFSPKPRRLARGLNDLFARQSGPVQVNAKPREAFVDDSSAGAAEDAAPAGDAEGQAQGRDGAPAAEPAVSSELAALAKAQMQPVASLAANANASTAMQVDASPSPTGFEYRFVQLVSRLDATCNLFADARQTHLVAAQRNSKIAWSVAGALALVAGIALWMSGSKATYNQAQLDYEQKRSSLIEKTRDELNRQNAIISAANESLSTQQQSLTGQYETVQEKAAATQMEIETIRRALGKANAVIDELMARPELPALP